MSNKTRSIVSTAISLAIVIFATIIYFYFRNRDTKGEKVYLDNVIYKEEYTLSFTTDTRYENGKSYYCVWLEITNTLTETQTFTIKNPYFKEELDETKQIIYGQTSLITSLRHIYSY